MTSRHQRNALADRIVEWAEKADANGGDPCDVGCGIDWPTIWQCFLRKTSRGWLFVLDNGQFFIQGRCT